MEFEIQAADSSWVALTGKVASGGWKESYQDIDGPNAGRNMLGTMIRDVVTSKSRYDVTLRIVTKSEKDLILSLLRRPQFNMRFKEEGDSSWTQKLVYTNNYSWTHYRTKPGGTETFQSFSFPLIEI